MTMRLRPALVAALAATALVVPAVLPGQPADARTVSCPAPVAGERFAQASPRALGFNPKELAAAIDYASDHYSTAVRVYRHGCLAGASERDPFVETVPAPLASSSKGVFSLVLGRAVTLGRLKLDDPIGKYLPEADKAHGALTVRMLLNQHSGLQFSWSDDVAGLATDPLRQVLKLPFIHKPKTTYEYHQTTLSVLGIIVERATGQELQAFAQEQLLGRVGIPRDHWVWLRDRAGYTVVAGGLLLRPDDQARLGQLMLNRGRWRGQQLVSQSYLRQAVSGTKSNPGHGFLFWLNEGDRYKLPSLPEGLWHKQPFFPGVPRDAYAFVGAGGQIIVIVPSRDMVIVRNGGPSRIDPADQAKYTSATTSPDIKEMIRRIVRAVRDQPDNTAPGPAAYDYPSESYRNPDHWHNVADASMVLGTVLNYAAGQDASCNLLLCGDRNLARDLAAYGTDAVAQVSAALSATVRDTVIGR